MLPLAPPLVFIALVGLRLRANRGQAWRIAAIEATVLLAAGIIAVSELLSVAGALRPGWVSLVWTLAATVSLWLIWRTWSHDSSTRRRLIRKAAWWREHTSPRPLEWGAIGIVILATGIIAWISPPTNFDSMTYQFPRVMHWLQQGTTDHYATTNVRQLSYGPGAAYWQLHLWSLWDGDRAACLVQWFASIGAAVALSVWLRRLVPAGALSLAILIGLTLPMGILQASSSQTDLQVTAWLLAGVVLLASASPQQRLRFICAGFAFGMAVLTKPVAVLVGLPLAGLVCWQKWRMFGVGSAVRMATVTAAMGLLVCAPHFGRNLVVFDHPVGPSAGTLLETHEGGALVANATRWLMLNVPVMSAWHTTAALLESAGVDVNDPATTFQGLHFAPARPEIVYRLWLPDEDFAAYTPTLILIGLCLLAGWRHREQATTARPWWIALAVSATLYPLLLQWQCWGNRLLLPLMWFALPLLLARTGIHRVAWGRHMLVAALMLQAGFYLTFSLNRPLAPLPENWRFAGNTQPPYSLSRDERFYLGYNGEAADTARQFALLAREHKWRAIGLQTDWNYPEYVLWRALHEAGLDHVQVHHTTTVEGHGLTPVAMRFDGYVKVESVLPPP